MQIDSPIIFVEINSSNYIFTSGLFDENQNFKVTEKIIAPNKDVKNNKFTRLSHKSYPKLD